MLTAEERKLRAQLAAHERWSRTAAPTNRAHSARKAAEKRLAYKWAAARRLRAEAERLEAEVWAALPEHSRADA